MERLGKRKRHCLENKCDFLFEQANKLCKELVIDAEPKREIEIKKIKETYEQSLRAQGEVIMDAKKAIYGNAQIDKLRKNIQILKRISSIGIFKMFVIFRC